MMEHGPCGLPVMFLVGILTAWARLALAPAGLERAKDLAEPWVSNGVLVVPFVRDHDLQRGGGALSWGGAHWGETP